MIQRLPNGLEIKIPFKTIFRSERYLIRKLNDSLSTGHNFIGQCKLSPRMTMIILSYLFSIMQQSNKNKVYYVCETKARCKQIRQKAEQLKAYFMKTQSTLKIQKPDSQQILSGASFHLEKSSIFLIQRFFHNEEQLFRNFPNQKFFSIVSIKQYFEQIIKQKVNMSSGGKVPIKADYMLIETVSYDQILENAISGWVNEIVIRRASIEFKKLQKYYHQRDDKKKNQKRNNINLGEKKPSLQDFCQIIKHQTSQRQFLNKALRQNPKRQKQKPWSITEVEKRILDIYVFKKEQLLRKSDRNKDRENPLSKLDLLNNETFEQKAFLALQKVGYLISYLQNYQMQFRQFFKTKDENMTEQLKSVKFLEDISHKLLLDLKSIKELYNFMKRLFQLHPPVIKVSEYPPNSTYFTKGRDGNSYTLSTQHILQVTKFFSDLITYQEVFTKKYSECIEVLKSSFREKDRASFFELRFRCLNQPLLTQIILEFNENFIVLMNNGISFEYYTTIFKPKILMKNQESIDIYKIEERIENIKIEQQASEMVDEKEQRSFKFTFQSPTNTFEQCYSAKLHNIGTLGLNVTITPSEETLKTPQFLLKQDQQHDSLIVKAYGVLIYDLCEVVSDGMIVYFPSAIILKKFRKEWIQKQDIYRKINQIKRIYEESQFEQENIQNIKEFKKACDFGRGGIYLLAANGGMAKYTEFKAHYSRAVIFLGYPKSTQMNRKRQFFTVNDKQNLGIEQGPQLPQIKQIPIIQQKSEKKKKEHPLHQFKQSQLQFLYGLKMTAKCLSNCIDLTIQPKIIIFADSNYNKVTTKKWFPFIQQRSINTSQVIEKVKKFNQRSQKCFLEGLNWQSYGHNHDKQTIFQLRNPTFYYPSAYNGDVKNEMPYFESFRSFSIHD